MCAEAKPVESYRLTGIHLKDSKQVSLASVGDFPFGTAAKQPVQEKQPKIRSKPIDKNELIVISMPKTEIEWQHLGTQLDKAINTGGTIEKEASGINFGKALFTVDTNLQNNLPRSADPITALLKPSSESLESFFQSGRRVDESSQHQSSFQTLVLPA